MGNPDSESGAAGKCHKELFFAIRAVHPCHFAKSYKTGTAESRNTLRNRSEADKPFFKVTALEELIDRRAYYGMPVTVPLLVSFRIHFLELIEVVTNRS